MKLSLFPYRLHFKFPFHIAHGVRSHTDAVYVKLEHENITAWGEATLPPYLPETQQSVMEYLTSFSKNLSANSMDDWFEKLSAVQTNMSAKAALDMALWEMKAKMENKTIRQLLGIEGQTSPPCFYTIGACSPDEMKQRMDDGLLHGFGNFKLKLTGTKNDYETVKHFSSQCDKSFAVDVNGGWSNVSDAGKFISFLQDKRCLLVEQPLRKDLLSEMKVLKKESPVPLYADESCQRLMDIEKLSESFHGINIKLMKCGGITEAYQMMLKARQLKLEVLIGCMSESSVGCTAATHLAAMADYADLDGPWLINNDPFNGLKIEDGKIRICPLTEKVRL